MSLKPKIHPSKYWTVFYTKPRNEKKSAERLTKQGFEIYAPTRIVLKQWSDRKKKVEEPLFTSYLFAKVDEVERLKILEDYGVVKNLFWLNLPVRVREEEIQAIKEFLNEHPSAVAHPIKWELGERVKVGEGPLTGREGIIKEIRNNSVVVRLIDLQFELQAELGPNEILKEK